MTRRPVGRETAIDTLRICELFGGLSDAEIEALASMLSLRRIPRRGSIFYQGDQGASLFIVERGTVHCHMVTQDGRELTVAVVGPGEILGELAFLDDRGRSATATALSDARLWVLNRGDFHDFIRRFPASAPPILAAMSERFRRTYDELRVRSFASTEARLALRLADLAHVHGRRHADGILIATRTTQGHLAELIGRSRVTVNKMLGRFEAVGLIKRAGHRIIIRDLAALKRMATEDAPIE